VAAAAEEVAIEGVVAFVEAEIEVVGDDRVEGVEEVVHHQCPRRFSGNSQSSSFMLLLTCRIIGTRRLPLQTLTSRS